MVSLHQSLSAKQTSFLRYFSFGIYFRHFGIKTTQEFIVHVLPPLLQFWRCTPEKDILVQDQLDSGKNIEGVVHHQSLFYILEIIRMELTSRYHDKSTLPSKRLENLLPGTTIKTCSYSQYLLIVRRAPIMIQFLSSLVDLQIWYITNLCRYQLMHSDFLSRLSTTKN